MWHPHTAFSWKITARLRIGRFCYCKRPSRHYLPGNSDAHCVDGARSDAHKDTSLSFCAEKPSSETLQRTSTEWRAVERRATATLYGSFHAVLCLILFTPKDYTHNFYWLLMRLIRWLSDQVHNQNKLELYNSTHTHTHIHAHTHIIDTHTHTHIQLHTLEHSKTSRRLIPIFQNYARFPKQQLNNQSLVLWFNRSIGYLLFNTRVLTALRLVP